MAESEEGKAPAASAPPPAASSRGSRQPVSNGSSSSSSSSASTGGANMGGMSGAQEFMPIIDELKKAYKSKILPLETAYKFEDFHSQSLTDTDFDAKPMVLLIGQYSTGKCWAPGTKLMMHDGSIKKVEHIQEGDALMGEDGAARTVKPGSIISGYAPMYEVRYDDDGARDSWQCNGDHILVLKIHSQPEPVFHEDACIWRVRYMTTAPGSDADSQLPTYAFLPQAFDTRTDAESYITHQWDGQHELTIEMSVHDYLKLAPELASMCTMYQPDAIHFPHSTSSESLQSRLARLLSIDVDASLVDRAARLMGAWILNGRTENGHAVLSSEQGGSESEQMQAAISALLSSYGVTCDESLRSIPHQLLTEQIAVRRSLLAGMLDACGESSVDGITLTDASRSLLDGVVKLARGVGCCASRITHMSDSIDVIPHTHPWSVCIMGQNLSKLALHRSDVKLYASNTRSDLHLPFSIHSVGDGIYHGFTVSGADGRFLMSDMIVTHNTTFIKYMLERDFPGSHIGPEPTTDRFVAVMHGKDERTIPGPATSSDATRPFTALNKFGMAFLNKFECSQCDAPILEKLTFIDTPGVLSGEKQRIGRSYDFPSIISWFAERADRILLLFDAHKLDISDEFKTAIDALRGQDDKIRVVLNKCGDIEQQHLMRVYGALMWSLGKVIRTPEVLRVYIGSFWDGPIKEADNVKLIRAEQGDLLADLRALPRNSTVRKINELVKRARMAKVHAHLLNHLRGKFGMFGKKKDQQKMLSDEQLAEHFRTVQQTCNLPPGDFPNMRRFREMVEQYEIWKFPKLDKKLIAAMDEVLSRDIPGLMRRLPLDSHDGDAAKFKEYREAVEVNPFASDPDREIVHAGWTITAAMKRRYDNEFFALDLGPDEKASGASCRKLFLKSKVDPSKLRVIWDLSDIDKDGALDAAEFAVAMYLIEQVQQGGEVPSVLPDDLVPPTKR